MPSNFHCVQYANKVQVFCDYLFSIYEENLELCVANIWYRFKCQKSCVLEYSLHKKWSFLLRISLVNVTKCAVFEGLATFTEKIHNGKFCFLCSDFMQCYKSIWFNLRNEDLINYRDNDISWAQKVLELYFRKNDMILKSKGDWNKLRAKLCFCR